MQETQEMWVWSLGREYTLEKGIETHSSILAWRIPWTEEPGRPQSMGSQRVRHDKATSHAWQSLCKHTNLRGGWLGESRGFSEAAAGPSAHDAGNRYKHCFTTETIVEVRVSAQISSAFSSKILCCRSHSLALIFTHFKKCPTAPCVIFHLPKLKTVGCDQQLDGLLRVARRPQTFSRTQQFC